MSVLMCIYVISGITCTLEFGVVQRVCVRTDLCLGVWEALSPNLLGPNQIAIDKHLEITFHGEVWVSSQFSKIPQTHTKCTT